MNTDKKAVMGVRTVAGGNEHLENGKWLPISENRAWSLCGKEGKSAPYAGYMTKLSKAYVRCARTANGHIFDVLYI